MSDYKAIMMKTSDNVATVEEIIEPDRKVILEIEGQHATVRFIERIPFGHKLATRDIGERCPRRKIRGADGGCDKGHQGWQ